MLKKIKTVKNTAKASFVNNIQKLIAKYYRKYLENPIISLFAVIIICILSAYNSLNFYYDASADTLVAENDPDLLYYREISSHFSGGDFLFLTYTPKNAPLISKETIAQIDNISNKLLAINGVSDVTSLLNAPLLKSPPIPISKLSTDYKTLKSSDVDLDAAFKELTTSPMFKNLLISQDGTTTAFRISLQENKELKKLATKRNELRILKNKTAQQKEQLVEINNKYRKAYATHTKSLEKMLNEIRSVRDELRNNATSYLGGVPMIASDMMNYVKKDVLIFGLLSTLFMMAALYFFYCRKLRWVFLPIANTAITILIMVGLLGFLHKPVSVISSNFISLLIILSISISVHLINKYREILDETRDLSHLDIVYNTMISKFAPCFYTTLTTCVGFASLYTSSIIPVMDFSWIMCVGVITAFLVGYLFFPPMLLLLPKEVLTCPARDNGTPFIRHAYLLAFNKTKEVILLSAFLVVLSGIGISQLSLDNRFIDYFKSNTEINKGLTFIDKNMGGTIPMDIIVTYPPFVQEVIDDDDDFFDEEADTFPERYWFTADKIDTLRKIEKYLSSRPEIGKIISLSTLETIAQDFNDNKPLTSVELVAILGAMPDAVRNDFIAPYASPHAGLMRISTRIHETGPTFSRDKLIKDIENFAIKQLDLKENQVKATGMNVLFNGMLKELFSSQTSTLIFVILATLSMFWILLNNVKLAIIGIFPNILSAFAVLAFMGFVGMPLDMMTITIAAIVIGIGVDDAIHYLYHFKEEYTKHKDVDEAVRMSHREIGRAIYITSLTVVIGFSVLCASSFVPTIYFGLLTALAMIFFFFSNLRLLPALLLRFYK